MYAEDFFDHSDHKFPLLTRLVEFAKTHNLPDLKHRARKLRERHKRVADEGGLATQLPSIQQYTYTLDYDSNDMIYAQERAQMFDISEFFCFLERNIAIFRQRQLCANRRAAHFLGLRKFLCSFVGLGQNCLRF